MGRRDDRTRSTREIITMNKELFKEITGQKPMTEEELNNKRKEMVGEGLDELDDEYMNMLEVTYNIANIDEVVAVEELGAATTVIIVVLDKDDVVKPHKEDNELLESMKQQDNYVSDVALYMSEDNDVNIQTAGTVPARDNTVQIEAWT